MADTPTIIWRGKSGKEYKYWIFPISKMSGFKDEPGNYIFAKLTDRGYYAIYVGQTGDLSERFDDHHKMPCIKRNGATHIHAHTSSPNEDTRLREEEDIIAEWNPPCNG
jgi:hypothetical protein